MVAVFHLIVIVDKFPFGAACAAAINLYIIIRIPFSSYLYAFPFWDALVQTEFPDHLQMDGHEKNSQA